VVNVTWNDVTAFCTWLSEKEGEITHLPSEAQWEYACRAGTRTTWYSGDDEESLKRHAWFSFNSEAKLHPVCQKSPNAWWLYDMHGNVWEWCQDWWAADYCGASPLDDPTGPGGGSDQIGRGGQLVRRRALLPGVVPRQERPRHPRRQLRLPPRADRILSEERIRERAEKRR
jgi:formylglycine-generating enzyme required for sulfatase activity